MAFKLPKHTEINDYAIKLVDANGFNRPFNSPKDALIFFDQESDESFQLYVWGFNNVAFN